MRRPAYDGCEFAHLGGASVGGDDFNNEKTVLVQRVCLPRQAVLKFAPPLEFLARNVAVPDFQARIRGDRRNGKRKVGSDYDCESDQDNEEDLAPRKRSEEAAHRPLPLNTVSTNARSPLVMSSTQNLNSVLAFAAASEAAGAVT